MDSFETRILVVLAWAALCSSAHAGPGTPVPSETEPAPRRVAVRVDEGAEGKLALWYERVGAPLPSESFGHFVTRTARIQHGAKYAEIHESPTTETLRINLDAFECVSFIESTLAVARCGWRSEPTARCFIEELEASRYRDGVMGDYATRLHYFVDWIDDNERRGRLVNLTAPLGGEPVHKHFFYITERVLARSGIGAGELAPLTRELQATEKRLSAGTHSILSRDRAPGVLRDVQDGDLIAFVRERPGMLVHHAGFVYWSNGTPRLLHASSYHGRVVLTVRDVTDYLLRRPERRGVIVARPLAPPTHP